MTNKTEFTADDWFAIDDDKRKVVIDWLKKYNLYPSNVIKRVDYKHEYGYDVKLEAWGDHLVTVHALKYKDQKGPPFNYIYMGEPEDAERLVAIFEWDDFPWEVLDEV